MTTSRDILERLNSQKQMIDAQMDSLNEQLGSIKEEHENALREMLYEEKILSRVVWVAQVSPGGKWISLVPHKDYNKAAQKIAEMLDNDGWYHFGFELKEPGFTFRFDDFEIQILMDPATVTNDALSAFIQNNKLQIDISNMDEMISLHESRAKALKDIKNVVG